MIQLPLDLGLPAEPPETVISRANEAAYRMVDCLAEWPHPVAVVTGPAGSGKSHLARIFCEAPGASCISGRALALCDPVALARGAVAVDDAHDADEAALFHLINAVRGAGGRLLLTMQADWSPSLADLRSRLGAAPRAALEPPDDALLRRVLAEGFVRRQLAPDPRVIDYLMARMERTLHAADDVVRRMDQAGLAARRPPTRILAGEVLRTGSPAAPSVR